MPSEPTFRLDYHIHFKNNFRRTSELRKFVTEMEKFLRVEVKKIKHFRFIMTERPFVTGLKSASGAFTIGYAKDHADIIIRAGLTPRIIGVCDELLNKMMSFVAASTPSFKEIGYAYAEETPVNKNPIEPFLNRVAIVEFSSKSLMHFSPAFFALDTTEKDHKVLVSLEYDETDRESSVEIVDMKKTLDKHPYGVIRESGKSVNQIRERMLMALGVEEKRSPSKKR